jgi:hypothetical protein
MVKEQSHLCVFIQGSYTADELMGIALGLKGAEDYLRSLEHVDPCIVEQVLEKFMSDTPAPGATMQ